jgi:coenzyme F420-reducing hydrogenase delta subunit
MPQFFEAFPVVTLNDTWKFLPEGSVDIAFSNNLKFIENTHAKITVVKGRNKWQEHPSPKKHFDNHVRFDDPDRFVFSYYSHDLGDDRDHFRECELWNDPVFYWNVPHGSVSIFAIQMALRCGAKSILLVGCDASSVLGRYHHQKKSSARHQDYEAYYRGNARMIKEARERFRVPIVSVTPWAGIGNEQRKFAEMQGWINKS